jgi:HMG (high mobility group) box
MFTLTQIQQEKPSRAQPSGTRRRSSTAGTSYTTLSETSPPPPVYHPPPRAQPTNLRLNVVMQHPTSGKGRRGTSGGGRGGSRPSPAPKVHRDPNAPKRPTNPFLRFCEQERDNVRALHGGDENFDLTKAMGQAWHGLDDEQKQPYKEAFNEDQKRYKEDMVVYEALKRRPVPLPPHHHHHHHHHHAHQPSSRTEEYSNYGDEMESEDGVADVANVTGRESVDPMGDVVSNADVGTPGGSTPGPGAGGFTAVNRRSGGLDATMFKQEE